jgi:uncharacterized surface protein with fasciclin (FAS1) repeats
MLLPLIIALVVSGIASQDTTTAGTTTQKPSRPPPTIAKILGKNAHYSIFLDLLNKSGLTAQLDALQNLTLFAPMNSAFSSLTSAEFQALESDPRVLKELLQYHVSDGPLFKANVRGRNNDKTLTSMDHGLPIRINVYDQVHSLAAEGVNITEKNMHVANGWIHGIDGIMEPPKGDIVEIINNTPELSTLASLIASSGLDATIRADHNITVFAPTNAALASLNPAVLSYLQHSASDLQEVLEYHIVPKTSLYSIGMRHQMLFETAAGKRRDHDQLMLLENDDDGYAKVFINNAQVTKPDVSATNGVLHEIDDLLIPTDILVKMEDSGLGHHIG